MKKTLVLVGVAFVSILLIMLMGNIITIGEKITKVTGVVYLEYGFYALIAAFLLWLIIPPLYRIYRTPEFPVLAVEDKEEQMSEEDYRKKLLRFGNRLAGNCYYLKEETREAHELDFRKQLFEQSSAQDTEGLKKVLKDEIDQRLKKIDSRIMGYSTKVFLITTISQSGRVDFFSMMALNYRMIGEIIRTSGFRPTSTQLLKQYGWVIGASFFSYFLSDSISFNDQLIDMDAADLDTGDFELADVDLGESGPGIFKSIKIPGIALDSLFDGMTSALLTMRVGYITKAYLKKGSKALRGPAGAATRREAIKDALKNLPSIMRQVSGNVSKGTLGKMLKVFTRWYEKKETTEPLPAVAEETVRKRSFWDWFRIR